MKVTNTSASVVLEHTYDDEGFPICYKCKMEYKLTAVNTLEIITTIKNLDNKLMPLVDGSHPYFKLGDNINDCQLEFQSKAVLEFENLIPTGRLISFQEFRSLKGIETTVFDNCFTLNFAECSLYVLSEILQRKSRVKFILHLLSHISRFIHLHKEIALLSKI